MIVERVEPTPRQRLFTVHAAARELGLTEAALRAQIFRGRVRTVSLGKRVYLTPDEIDRLSGR